MQRMSGTVARGIRAPIFNRGDDVVDLVVRCVTEASRIEGFSIRDRDVVAVTESIVARTQGNYATVEQIAADIRGKFGDHPIGVIFPILSRNRFAACLKGIARGAKEIILMLGYPCDEVGNQLLSEEVLEEKNINPWTDVLTEQQYRSLFGHPTHLFTGIDYVDYYHTLVKAAGIPYRILFSNRPDTILEYTRHVLACDIHTREKTKRILRARGAKTVYGLDDILRSSVCGSGYNEDFGLLGSNLADEDTVKLFPRNCQILVDRIQQRIRDATGKTVEVMVYGDGAFKDPVGQIWELADPVVSPGYTCGLKGVLGEVKLKYLADNQFRELKGEAQRKAIAAFIRNKDVRLVGKMDSQGTTPRRITDLIGSLADLISGSGDKGTPIVHIQGYFDHYEE